MVAKAINLVRFFVSYLKNRYESCNISPTFDFFEYVIYENEKDVRTK
jgi:hypothetical protein